MELENLRKKLKKVDRDRFDSFCKGYLLGLCRNGDFACDAKDKLYALIRGWNRDYPYSDMWTK